MKKITLLINNITLYKKITLLISNIILYKLISMRVWNMFNRDLRSGLIYSNLADANIRISDIETTVYYPL